MSSTARQRWQVLSPLLDELLDLEGEARARRLDALWAQDAALADELSTLLRQEQALSEQGLLDRPAVEALRLGGPDQAALAAGLVIGPYRLERELGQGGMGSVWTAQRADGRFDGRVAVKFLKSGLFAAGDAGRFAREGQILARLSHPHIARLLDAGVVQGQPYLVLEYVDGQPIDAWCRERGLDVQARVRLLLDVLAAVGHAHARLILHRDLKPGNILVTREGEVKLLDFGIAKLLDDAGQGTASTELTQLAGHAYTPQYAAPEQVQQAEVTTATDVYALGVLLYQLLGGGHPTLADTQTRLDQLKAVVEQVPRRLSEAAARGDDPQLARQARQLRGDLDTIVAKALKKQPAERYANAPALADDLQRWLAREPIGARPDSRLYVWSRFVQRHRWAVAAGSAAVLALVGLTAVSALQARRAEAAEQQAQARRQQAEDLMSYMLGEFADKLRPLGKLALLDSIGGRALSQLTTEAPRQPAERLNRAQALTVIGEVRVERRELDAAVQPLQAARSLLAGDPPEPGLTATWRKAQGAAAFWLGQVHNLQREMALARQAWEDYRGVSQAWLHEQPGEPQALQELSSAHTNLGSLAFNDGRIVDAGREFSASLALKRQALPGLPELQRAAAQADLANTAGWLGKAQLWQGDAEAARRTLDEALSAVAPWRRERPDDAASARAEASLIRWLAEAHAAAGQPEEAGRAAALASARSTELVARDGANKTWRAEAITIQLLALELAPPPPAAMRAALTAADTELARLEQDPGASRWRRLPDRAHWARLMLAAAAPADAQAARDRVHAVREQLRDALAQGRDRMRLAGALATLDAALVSRAWTRPEACAMVRADIALLEERGLTAALVVAAEAVAACAERAAVTNTPAAPPALR